MDFFIADHKRRGIRILDFATQGPDRGSVGGIRVVQGTKRSTVAAGESSACAIAVFVILDEAPEMEGKRIDVSPFEGIVAVQNRVAENPV